MVIQYHIVIKIQTQKGGNVMTKFINELTDIAKQLKT